MPNFAQEWPLLLFMPLIIFSLTVLTVAAVNVVLVIQTIRGRRLASQRMIARAPAKPTLRLVTPQMANP
jgi:hypothetical protein